MNKDSIIFSTTINYIITILLILFGFSFLISYEKSSKEEQVFDKYRPIIKMLNKQKFRYENEFIKNLKELNYEIFTNSQEIKNIYEKENKKLIFWKDKHKESFKIFELENSYYILFSRENEEILIKDNDSKNFTDNVYIIFVFLTLFLVTTFLYIKTLKKLMPLKRLKDQVINLANESFDFKLDDKNSKDEVSLLAIEFKKTAQKLKDIKESRNIFIRNIMHELKTPITKGNFLLSLEKNEENIEKLKRVFSKLESLINEFANIEELISTQKEIEKRSYYLEDIIDNAKDILMIEDESLICEYENIKLNVNFKLFSIAIKNLIDNGIKYSNEKRVTIKTFNENIIFENSGEMLKGDFEAYLEPFLKKSSNDSFGLGLYIVYNILKANEYDLVYKYEDGKNIFILTKDIKFTI